MSWCPECKKEYSEDIQTCNDCNTNLIDSLDNVTVDDVQLVEIENESDADKFMKYLQYCNINSGTLILNKASGTYLIFVNKSDEKQAKKFYKAFDEVELEPDSEVEDDTDMELDSSSILEDEENVHEYKLKDEDFDSDDFESKDDKSVSRASKDGNKSKKNSGAYVKKRDQYNDLRSSFVMFTFVSILGFAFLLLNAFKVIQIYNNPIQYIVTTLMFVAFLYVGISSLLRSKKVYKEIGEEEALTEQLTQWMISNITLIDLNKSINENLSDEMLFYKHIELIKNRINETFGEIEDSYLDLIVEDFYNTHLDV